MKRTILIIALSFFYSMGKAQLHYAKDYPTSPLSKDKMYITVIDTNGLSIPSRDHYTHREFPDIRSIIILDKYNHSEIQVKDGKPISNKDYTVLIRDHTLIVIKIDKQTCKKQLK